MRRKSKLRLLIIGRTGQLGSALIKDAISADHEVISPPKQELNILDAGDGAFHETLIKYKPEIVINTAALNDLILCEKEPEKAFRMNSIAVTRMAEISNRHGIWFVSVSTDYVFDGKKESPYTETDAPGPLQIYGLSKLSGEYGALSYDKSVIIRTCGLYGGKGSPQKGNFVLNRIEDSRNRNSRIEMSSELTCSPTYAGDLSKAVLQLIEHGQTEKGIYHLVNEGECTWYEFTNEIYKLLNINTEVVPVNRRGLQVFRVEEIKTHGGRTGNMRRPLFTPLKNEKAKRLGIVMPHWKDALQRYLEACN